MFGLGPTEIIIILFIILIIFGAGRLPEIRSALGKGIRSFKKATEDEEERDQMDKPEKEDSEDSESSRKE